MSDTPPDTPPDSPGDQPAGVPDGTILETPDGDAVIQERVVNDYDDSGAVIGWHKEPVSGSEGQ